MTDLKDRLTLLLAGEPAAPDDLAAVIGSGRGARRRRSLPTGAATIGSTAALAVAVVVPLNLAHGSSGTTAVVASQPPAPAPTTRAHHCKWYRVKHKANHKGEYVVVTGKHHGKVTLYTCKMVKPRPKPSS